MHPLGRAVDLDFRMHALVLVDNINSISAFSYTFKISLNPISAVEIILRCGGQTLL